MELSALVWLILDDVSSLRSLPINKQTNKSSKMQNSVEFCLLKAACALSFVLYSTGIFVTIISSKDPDVINSNTVSYLNILRHNRLLQKRFRNGRSLSSKWSSALMSCVDLSFWFYTFGIILTDIVPRNGIRFKCGFVSIPSGLFLPDRGGG